ncbi:Hsp70 family protein, partial [Actinomadura syzygii]|uniref:Hsp70 family protein n=1 Tax=Actinomadura syzygii TaxID=1427538 RepID=UPI00361A9FE7
MTERGTSGHSCGQQTNRPHPGATGERYTGETTEDENMARAVGIDLGTTNSVVAILEGGEPTV